MLTNIFLIIGLIFFSPHLFGQQAAATSVVWHVNNLTSIGGHATTLLGSPVVVETDQGACVEFDGVDDGLIVEANPAAGAESFTVEVIFKPYASNSSSNAEQRFIHIQESEDRRLLIELRLTDDNQWFLDTFIKDGASSATLYAEDFKHSVEEWHHAALVYENGMMRHYVNGQEEMSGAVQYAPMQSGQTSIGVRLNQRSWYKGAIRMLKVTHRALTPEEILNTQTRISAAGKHPGEFQLCQNYPNPFNAETKLEYYLPYACKVKICLYNTLGLQKMILEEKSKPAGHHTFSINAKNFVSGIYFFELSADTQFRARKKIILIK